MENNNNQENNATIDCEESLRKIQVKLDLYNNSLNFIEYSINNSKNMNLKNEVGLNFLKKSLEEAKNLSQSAHNEINSTNINEITKKIVDTCLTDNKTLTGHYGHVVTSLVVLAHCPPILVVLMHWPCCQMAN